MFSSQNSQVSSDANYIEDVFSTYLYQADGSSTKTITNGIDLAGKGGLVWIKSRSNATGNVLVDTVRGSPYVIQSNTTNAQGNWTNEFGSFSSTGFTVPYNTIYGETNFQTRTYASWTFRKQPKFFDVVTWTGSNDSGTSIGQGIVPHNLGSAPGCVIIKNVTQGSTNWIVYHRSLSGGYRMLLNTTDAQTNSGSAAYFSKYVNGVGWTQTDPDANNIYVGYNYQTNGNGDTLVAYLFAHNAGGFGLTGTDNVISCGSFTTDGSGNFSVNLGYEPQWILAKQATGSANNWAIFDNMRGMSNTNVARLIPNSSSAESDFASPYCVPSATGFYSNSGGFFDASQTVIYIAIRRGPMKVPTSGTSVLQTLTYTGNGSSGRIYSGVTTVPDLAIATSRSNTSPKNWCDRLRGEKPMISTSTDGESGTSQEGKTIIAGSANGTVTFGSYWGDAAVNTNGYTYVNYLLSRAPSFFDEVCYTGTGNNNTSITHNLAVVPELIIVKDRSAVIDWGVYHQAIGQAYAIYLNQSSAAAYVGDFWGTTAFTSTTFRVGNYSALNTNTEKYVAYLFATCAGVSKVGSYTGNGTTQTINCGFTGGARFVLIKRTDSTGDWYVWDTARGIISANDPHLSLNTTAAEVTTDDTIDTDSTGFIVNQVTATNVNVSSATYIYLAIA